MRSFKMRVSVSYNAGGLDWLCACLYRDYSDKPSGRLALCFELMDMNIYEHIRNRKTYLPENKVKLFIVFSRFLTRVSQEEEEVALQSHASFDPNVSSRKLFSLLHGVSSAAHNVTPSRSCVHACTAVSCFKS